MAHDAFASDIYWNIGTADLNFNVLLFPFKVWRSCLQYP